MDPRRTFPGCAHVKPGITNRLNDLVSFQVQDATLDELLRAFLGPAGLSYQIDEQTLLILPGRSD